MLDMTLMQKAPTGVVAFVLLVFIIIFYLIGYRVRKYYNKRNPEFEKSDLGTINGTLVGLLGLLLAFTFSMSSSRYDSRREVIIEEANDIGTAILRADLYPDSMRKLLREDFKIYVDARIKYYTVGRNYEKIIRNFLLADSIGKQIWNIVATDAKVNNNVLRSGQMIPAVNAMIDITTTRRSLGESTVPDSIMYFLFMLCLGSAFLLGYDHKFKSVDWILVLGLAIMISFTVFNIIDLDRTRSGLINMDVPNQKIVELMDMLK